MLDTYGIALLLTISLSPAVEVRGSIPLALLLYDGIDEFYATIVCIVGNLLIAPIALTLLNHVDKILRNSNYIPKTIRSIYLRILNSARSRGSKTVSKYGLLGLAVFVAVPLPGTGAWTGSLIAYLLGIEKSKAIAAIEVGVIAASVIVFSATYLGIEVIKKVFLIP